MKQYSYFVKGRAIFGGYPNPEHIPKFLKLGVKYFVNLTVDGEKGTLNYDAENKIDYPIIDNQIPQNWNTFSIFLYKIYNIIISLKNDEKILIHCRGGHGRAGVVVSCLLCLIHKISPVEALKMTNEYYGQRKELKEKWRELGCPNSQKQKKFVLKFFEPIYFYKSYKTCATDGFSNFSLHPVFVDGLGIFPTSEAAYNAHKNLEDEKYIQKQINSKTPIISKRLGKTCKLRQDWELVRLSIMENIIRLKIQQNEAVKINLLNTGFRPIVESNKNDEFWGIGKEGHGLNMLGKILERIRLEYYR